MTEKVLTELLIDLKSLPKENEWVEFKKDFHSKEEIGKALSSLSNSAAIQKQSFGYLVFGIENETHKTKGCTFNPAIKKVGNEELKNWLMQRLDPKIDFFYFKFKFENKNIVLFQIPAASGQPTRFSHTAYIRIETITRKLRDFPELEKQLWVQQATQNFCSELSVENILSDEIISLLDTQAYFDFFEIPYPTNRESVLEKFISENFIKKNSFGKYSITNLGGLLFAKDLSKFPNLWRKAIRVIVYKGKNRVQTEREQTGGKGYAIGFKGLLDWVNSQLPANEEIGKAFRKEVRMYPEIAIRELVANMLIHQDFRIGGSCPVIEIFSDRIEFTNPGIPLITTDRFIDEYQSRNEDLASFMRRINICEEKGSGIDKVIFNIELYQLPAPDFQKSEKHTKSILYSKQNLNDMDKNDKVRACYQHCCLGYVSNEKMTNQSLRKRFNIDDKNSATASRIIRDSLESELIKVDDPHSSSRKFKKYIPFWA